MLSEPRYGWTTFTLNGFSCPSSYLTNTPENLLDCFISLMENWNGYCFFDGEGTDCELFISRDSVIAVSSKETREVLDLTPDDYSPDIIKEWANELIGDIERDFNAWAKWDIFEDEDSEEYAAELKATKDALADKIQRLRACLKAQATEFLAEARGCAENNEERTF